jgi:hypothetical protein
MRIAPKITLCLAALALTGGAAFSAEIVELRNGFLVHVDHREKRGNQTRLYLDGDSQNFVDVSDDQIVSSEEEPKPEPEPPAQPAVNSDRKPSLEEIVRMQQVRS